MFQSFEVKTNPSHASHRVAALRQEMQRLGLDGFLIPRADEHQGEYVPPHSERLSWLTGFTGSAGMALVLKDKAVIFVDGRYTVQVRQQTDPAVFIYEDLLSCPPSQWLQKNAKGLTIGFDPWLHTISSVKALKTAVENHGQGKLIATNNNLVDLIWTDQPQPPVEPVTIQPLQYSGLPTDRKLLDIQNSILQSGAGATILTDPSSVAWLFNIRGNDVSNTPFALCFACIPAAGRPTLFINKNKLGHAEQSYLQTFTEIVEPDAMASHIVKLASGATVFGLDSLLAADKFREIIEENNGIVINMVDPARLPRAIKNDAELSGSRAAHLRDGVALCKFFSWLDRQSLSSLDEIKAAKKLEKYRYLTAQMMGSKLEDLSFDTISGCGPNGAIIHYRVNEDSNRIFNEGELYLVDSGAQYRDGTTDVTRTVAIGQASHEEIRCFTLVLKGMIAISSARFPAGSRGQDIDVLARNALWKAGLDYAHGTGHGVGAYLSVHEGPQNLSKRGAQELLPGMIISNEPGYYREGAFGIRIENLLAVEPSSPIDGGDQAMLGFETLTFCPIDRRLIAVDMLNQDERDWLNKYHKQVFQTIAPYLDDEMDKDWLKQATATI